MHTEFFTYLGVEIASADNETTSRKTTSDSMSSTSKAYSKELAIVLSVQYVNRDVHVGMTVPKAFEQFAGKAVMMA